MNVQQPQMNLIQELNERHSKKLKETMYPETLPLNWIAAAREALSYNSLLSLGISGKDYSALIGSLGAHSLTMMQFAILSNMMEAVTPANLSISIEEYDYLMQAVSALSIRWNEESDKIKAEVKQEVEMLLAATAPDRPAMQIVKGEA